MAEVKKSEVAGKKYYYAVGRRKSAVATVRLMEGKGSLTVNEMPVGEYVNNATLLKLVQEPLAVVSKAAQIDAIIRVSGGGRRGQVDAIRLGLARSLVLLNEDYHLTLKKAGLLTRDPREKERKKYGLKKARKAPQFSKR